MEKNNEDGFSYATGISVSADGNYVYISDEDGGGIAVFKLNSTDANVALDFVESHFDGQDGVDGIATPIALTVSPDGSNLYVAGSEDNALAIFKKETNADTLTYVMKEESGDEGLSGLTGVASSFITTDGNHLYAAGSSDNALVAFSRDSVSGKLTYIDSYFDNVDGIDGLGGIRQITSSPDDKYVYATGWGEDAVVVFIRDENTGELSFHSIYKNNVDGVEGIDAPNSITHSPDGKHIYVSANNSNSVAVFTQNTTTDSLEFIHAKFDGQDNQIDGLKGASSVVVSKDGNYVYVTGSTDHGFAIFDRDQSTGELTYKAFIEDDVNGVDGLFGVQSVSVSDNGNYYYFTSTLESAISVFSKGTDGMLDFVEVIKDGENDVSGLTNVRIGTMNPDGRHFYAAGTGANAVAIFLIDQSTGKLNFLKKVEDGVEDNNGLAAVYSVSVSPDGRYIYSSGVLDDAIGVYRNLYRIDLDQTICNGESYNVGTSNYTETGSYIDTTDAQIGSRVITNLDLTVVTVDASGTMGYDSQADTGTVYLTVSGGVEPYTYLWNDESTEKNLSGVGAGNYTVTITDAAGCTKTVDFELSESTGTNEVDVTSFSAQLYPNRIKRGASAILNIENTQVQNVSIEVMDQLGRSLRAETQTLNVGSKSN